MDDCGRDSFAFDRPAKQVSLNPDIRAIQGLHDHIGD